MPSICDATAGSIDEADPAVADGFGGAPLGALDCGVGVCPAVVSCGIGVPVGMMGVGVAGAWVGAGGWVGPMLGAGVTVVQPTAKRTIERPIARRRRPSGTVVRII